MSRFFRKRLHPFDLLLEATGEIVRAILEKHHKAEGEEDEKNEPKKAAEQRHGRMVT